MQAVGSREVGCRQQAVVRSKSTVGDYCLLATCYFLLRSLTCSGLVQSKSRVSDHAARALLEFGAVQLTMVAR